MDSINIRDVRREAWRTLRSGSNYRNSALFILLLQLLTNLPIMLMYMFMPDAGVSLVSADELAALNTFVTRATVLQLLIGMFIVPPFTLSMSRFMLRQLETGTADSPMALFDGLDGKGYFLSVRANLWWLLMLYMWLMIPMSLGASYYAMYSIEKMRGTSIMAMLIAAGVLIAGVAVHRLLAYSMQFLILSRTPRAGAIMSLKLSALLTRGRKWEMIKLNLSMIHLYVPIFLPYALSFFVQGDGMWLSIVLSLCSILLGAMFMPLIYTVHTNYFRKVWDAASTQAKQAARQAPFPQQISWPSLDDSDGEDDAPAPYGSDDGSYKNGGANDSDDSDNGHADGAETDKPSSGDIGPEGRRPDDQ